MFNTLTTLAHAGHDHTYFLGGELHHWLWAGVGIIAVGLVATFVVRRWLQR
ncbi:MAG: hypothetical protein AAF086_02930 [Planctomycetota bacterium]